MNTVPGTGILVAARTDSRRLPGKALLPLAGVPSILFLLRRLRTVRRAHAIILATTDRPVDDELARLVEAEGIPVFRGATKDVAGRFVGAARAYGLQRVVRVTGDCPLLDGPMLDFCLERSGRADAVGADVVTTKGRFPVGIDCEIYPAERLAALHASGALDPEEREHVTLHFYRPGAGRLHRLEPPAGWPSVTRALTLDTPDDHDFLSRVIQAAGRADAPVRDVLEAALANGG